MGSFTQEGASFYVCPEGTTRTSGLLSENFNFDVDVLKANVGKKTVTILNTPVPAPVV